MPLSDFLAGAQPAPFPLYMRGFTRASGGMYFNPGGLLVPAGVNEPRYDHDPVTRAPRGILIEAARTNSMANNTMVGAALGIVGSGGAAPSNWAGSYTADGLTCTVAGIGVVAGIDYIDLRYAGTPTTTTGRIIAGNAIAASIGQTWTQSAWVGLVGGSWAGLSPLTLRSASEAGLSFTPTGDFVRRESTVTLTGTSAQFGLRWNALNTVTPIDFTLRVGLPQSEQGAFATSPIRTVNAGAVTRAADSLSVLSSLFPSSATEGTLYFEFSRPVVVADQRAGGLSNGSAGDFIAFIGGIGSPPQWRADVRATSVYQAQFSLTNGDAPNTINCAAIAYRIDDFAASLNGGAVLTDSAGTVPPFDRIDIGRIAGSGQSAMHVRRVAYWPRRMSNAELQGLTA